MEQLHLAPTRHVAGQIKLPGSKSISNRTLLLAALSQGDTLVRELLASDDIHHMRNALGLLGVEIEATGNEHDFCVKGSGGSFPIKNADLFLGNAGTAFRPLTAALAMMNGHYRLSGVARMHERPIGDLVDALRLAGADIRYQGQPGYPPLEIAPASIRTDDDIPVKGSVSSQFLTALLMALPLTGKTVSLCMDGELISKPYIAITINLMQRFGVKVEQQGWQRFTVPEGQHYLSPGEIMVEGDASSASYFLAAGVLAGGPVRVHGVGANSIQGDVRFAEVLSQMGATVSYGDNWIEAAAGETLRAVDVDLNHIPDAAMTVAMLALGAEGSTTIRNIASWRVKETDRLAAMATELRKLGAIVEEGADYIRITPPAALTANAVIDTYDDHRMAMCFSLASLLGVPVTINDPKCVAKTFPDYFERLAELAGEKA